MDVEYWNEKIRTSHPQTRSSNIPFPHLLKQWRKSMFLSLQLRHQRHSRIAGAALLTTINLHSSTARIVGYQLVYGFEVGLGQPSYIVQTLLPEKDVPIETQETAKTAISDSIIRTYYMSLALSCVSVVAALAIKWVPMQDPAKQDLVKQDTSSPEDTTQGQNGREGVKENEKQGEKQDGKITAA
ncbi:hypothetical protein BCON_0033g00200 [Botryotinia convoluta]|uniref:Major facilitator superfamily (MFS) profile domain-containing protein n=1 Tax=Botryotinia convoluta TaxID=54673 RepID=A0A4Z1IGW8_9HELO|nr:hypothetical protein BCON_0033g00200 [Botryotinia convoluta]